MDRQIFLLEQNKMPEFFHRFKPPTGYIQAESSLLYAIIFS